MPTYEYACTDCGQHVEVQQSMSDPPLTTCTACGGTLRKVFAPIGIVFKGSGFYRTDSRGAGKPGGEKGKAGAETAGKADAATTSTASSGSASASSSSSSAA